MKCYFCDRKLANGGNVGFVCICDRCLLDLTENSESIIVDKICELKGKTQPELSDKNKNYRYRIT